MVKIWREQPRLRQVFFERDRIIEGQDFADLKCVEKQKLSAFKARFRATNQIRYT